MTGESPFRPPAVLSFRVDDDDTGSLDERGRHDPPFLGPPSDPEPALDRLGTDFSPTPPTGIVRDRRR